MPQSVSSNVKTCERPLSSHQESVLEGLVIRIIALTLMQQTEVWLILKSHLGLKNESQLLSSHYPAAEKFLSKLLDTLNIRQLIHQIEDLLVSSDNRQQVYDFIRQSFNLTGLDQLNSVQLKQVLFFLKKNSSTTLKSQAWASQRKELNMLVSKLSTTTGKSEQMIWELIRNISGVKTNGQIMPKDYPLLISWLQVKQKLNLQSNINFSVVKEALRQLFEQKEWDKFVHHTQLRFEEASLATLTSAQVQDILYKAYIFQREQKTPSIKQFLQLQYNHILMPSIEPMKVLKAKRAQATIILAVVIFMSCTIIMIAAKSIMFW